MTAGVVFGLVVLAVVPMAVQSWLRAKNQAEHAAIRTYLEATQDASTVPGLNAYDPADVLGKIETYQAPPMPRGPLSWLTGNLEPYDARLRSGSWVPPTRADTLAADVQMLLTRFFPESTVPPSQAQVARALGLYLHVPWTALPGYRPWTHWNFVRGLSDPERNTLARQVTGRLGRGSGGNR